MNELNESTEPTGNPEPAETQPEDETVAQPVSQAAPLLLGVKLPIRVLLGRTQLCLRDVGQLGNGSVVELECSPSDPVELIVNDKVIAHGEVVVVGGNYGIRITRIAAPAGPDGFETTDLLKLSEKLKG